MVRTSSGGAWSTIDNYQYPSGNNSAPTAIVLDTSGNVYVAGHAMVSGGERWIVREYSAGSWATIDDYQYPTGTYAQANALTADTSGNIYVAGWAQDNSNNQHWIVRKYSAGSWTTSDDYQYPAGANNNAAAALTVDGSGNIYAAGTGRDSSNVLHWITRKYSAGSWTTSDDYDYSGIAGYPNQATALVLDSVGNVYAAGFSVDGGNVYHWMVRKYGAGTWSTIDNYDYPREVVNLSPTLWPQIPLETCLPRALVWIAPI